MYWYWISRGMTVRGLVFFFNDTATTEIYTLSLHDALPISSLLPAHLFGARRGSYTGAVDDHAGVFEQAHGGTLRSEEHTSELQSPDHIVCRLLLEKKNKSTSHSASRIVLLSRYLRSRGRTC